MSELEKFLSECERVIEHAESAPWKCIPGDSWCAYSHVRTKNKTFIIESHFHENCVGIKCEDGIPPSEKDAEFIAFSRSAMPKLVAALEVAVFNLSVSSSGSDLQIVKEIEKIINCSETVNKKEEK